MDIVHKDSTNVKPLIFLITKVRKFKKWTAMEDKLLMFVSKNFGCRNWKAIASHFPGRTQIQSSARYKRIRPGYNKGMWSHKEDMQLIKLIKLHGRDWSTLSSLLVNRTGKQIRDRYLNSLDPGLNKAGFSRGEDILIQKLYKKYGSKWTVIASQLPGRSGDMIKNRFYSVVKSQGKKGESSDAEAEGSEGVEEVGVNNIPGSGKKKGNELADSGVSTYTTYDISFNY
jgi:hypothetical protein